MMRSVISYDDIALPQVAPIVPMGPQIPGTHTHRPPPKKRKASGARQQNPRSQSTSRVQHWDDPGASASHISYGEGDGEGEGEAALVGNYPEEGADNVEEEEESRELTHDEIWDDSALVDAWNSAMAEYEAFHGKGGKWKEEPMKKSPLWYNVPPTNAGKNQKGKATTVGALSTSASRNGTTNADEPGEADSTPQNFGTFVPTHDPSLASVAPASGAGTASYSLPEPPGPMVSQDEAFSRALNAMYWSGYWTAIYHYHRADERVIDGGMDGGDEGVEEDGGGEEDQSEMLSAQR